MATLYLTNTNTANPPGGSNFCKTLSSTPPGAGTISITVSNLATEDDFATSYSDGNASTLVSTIRNGNSLGTWTVTIELSVGNIDLELSVALNHYRWNGSSWALVSPGSGFTGYTAEQNAASGPLTFNFVNPFTINSMNWSDGDAIVVGIRARDTSTMNNEALTYTIGSAGCRIDIPDPSYFDPVGSQMGFFGF